MKPDEIEIKSFEIIDREAGGHDFASDEWSIVRRMIHTSADFEYMESIRFHKDAIHAGINAILSGKNIITDTNMAKSGMRKKTIESYHGNIHCFINDPEVQKTAREKGETRAKVSVDMAVDMMKDGIYVVGNAPTALMRLIDLIKNKKASPALVLGFPVGFVNAAESKQMLTELDFPYITNSGRKGGSNIAASVVNALIILAQKEDKS